MRNMTFKRFIATTASVVALMACAMTEQAFAQTDDDEIIVTARKRDEALLDVPFSVNALSESQLRDRGAVSLEDVSKNVAGFSVQNLGPGQSQVAIRGISAGQIVRDQPGVKEQVGVYLDESVISLSLFTPDLDLFDLKRVEVLRGPQGTLFGSGSLSGTVRYITNAPSTDGFEGAVEMTASFVEDGELGGDLKGMVNIPFSDRAALRLVGFGSGFPGFIDARQPDGTVKEDVNGGSRYGGRAALELQLTQRLTVTPRVIYQDIEVGGYNRVDQFNILANPFTTTRAPVSLGDLEQFTQLEERFEDEYLLGDLTVAYDFGGVELTSITSYSDRDVLVLRDATQLTGSITGQAGVFASAGLPEAVFTLDAPLIDRTAVETLTQELRLASTGDNRFDWVAGVFYSDQDRTYSQRLPVAGFTAATGISTAGVRAPTDVLFFSEIPYNLKQYAVFGEGTFSLTDRLDITAGVRYSEYEEERVLTFDGVFATPTIAVPGAVEDDDIAPRVIVSYKATDNLTLNAQAARGFRLGGVNDPLNEPLCGDDLATFQPLFKPGFANETVWNYEAGFKSRIAGGRGSFTMAAYYSDIEDLQATVDAGDCSSRIIVNVPSAKAQGVEAELAARIGDQFDFAVSASYNEGELTSSVRDASGAVLASLREGNRLPTVPEFQAAFSATFIQPMRHNLEGFANLTFQHVGERFTQIADQENNPRTVTLISEIGATSVSTLSFPLDLPSYEVLNLRFGVKGEGWEGALFINNATDERAKLALDRERGLRARYGFLTNPPRTVGVTLRKTF